MKLSSDAVLSIIPNPDQVSPTSFLSTMSSGLIPDTEHLVDCLDAENGEVGVSPS